MIKEKEIEKKLKEYDEMKKEIKKKEEENYNLKK